jgi:hypothetical protein
MAAGLCRPPPARVLLRWRSGCCSRQATEAASSDRGDLQARLDAARQRLHEIVILRMKRGSARKRGEDCGRPRTGAASASGFTSRYLSDFARSSVGDGRSGTLRCDAPPSGARSAWACPLSGVNLPRPAPANAGVLDTAVLLNHCCGQRIPGRFPSVSMNSIPAAAKAPAIEDTVLLCGSTSPISNLRTVSVVMPAWTASFGRGQPKAARAA